MTRRTLIHRERGEGTKAPSAEWGGCSTRACCCSATMRMLSLGVSCGLLSTPAFRGCDKGKHVCKVAENHEIRDVAAHFSKQIFKPCTECSLWILYFGIV
jgi:hypothetical protein